MSRTEAIREPLHKSEILYAVIALLPSARPVGEHVVDVENDQLRNGTDKCRCPGDRCQKTRLIALHSQTVCKIQNITAKNHVGAHGRGVQHIDQPVDGHDDYHVRRGVSRRHGQVFIEFAQRASTLPLVGGHPA